MQTIERFVQVGQGYERDGFVADEDEPIEYEDQDEVEEAIDNDDNDEVEEATDNDDSDDDSDDDKEELSSPPLFQRMTRARARAQQEQAAKSKKRQSEPEDAIYISEPESDEDLLASLSFSLDRHRLSFQQLYELHVQYEIKRLLYPRIAASLQDKSSSVYKQAHMLYADRLLPQIDACLKNLAFSQAWRTGTLESVRNMPFMVKKRLDESLVGSQHCDACQRVHTMVSYSLYFWGAKCKEGKTVKNAKKQIVKGYESKRGEEDDDDIAVAESRKMYVGDTCAPRLKLYHTLFHRDTHMMIELLDELDSLKRSLSSFRSLHKGKRVSVKVPVDNLEKNMVEDVMPAVASRWAHKMNRAIKKCANFTEGGKHVWSKRKDRNDINLFNTYDSDGSDSYFSSDDDEEEDGY